MAHEPAEEERDQRARRVWDYPSDPLKAGGMQVFIMTVGFVLTLVLVGIIVAWYLLSGPASGPAAR
jgi:hypothetical protein